MFPQLPKVMPSEPASPLPPFVRNAHAQRPHWRAFIAVSFIMQRWGTPETHGGGVEVMKLAISIHTWAALQQLKGQAL